MTLSRALKETLERNSAYLYYQRYKPVPVPERMKKYYLQDLEEMKTITRSIDREGRKVELKIATDVHRVWLTETGWVVIEIKVPERNFSQFEWVVAEKYKATEADVYWYGGKAHLIRLPEQNPKKRA